MFPFNDKIFGLGYFSFLARTFPFNDKIFGLGYFVFLAYTLICTAIGRPSSSILVLLLLKKAKFSDQGDKSNVAKLELTLIVQAVVPGGLALGPENSAPTRHDCGTNWYD